MKIFGIMKCQSIIDRHIIPTGAVYGKLNLKYTDKEFTGKVRPIFDKDGYPLFNKDGTQKTRRVYRYIDKQATILYSVEDLFLVSVGDKTYFKAWYKINDSAWHDESVLNHNALEVELNNFIARKIQAYCAQNKCGHFDLAMAIQRPHINHAREMSRQAAGRREVTPLQDSPFRGHPCYAFNGSIITDGNLDKTSMAKSVVATHKGAFNGLHGEKPVTVSTMRKDHKLVGNDPSFVKHVRKPDGSIRHYYSQEEFRIHEPELWEEWALKKLGIK